MNSKSEAKISIFMSNRTVFHDSVEPALIFVENGRISQIVRGKDLSLIKNVKNNYPNIKVEDFGNLVLMAGIFDSHVHVNEPGRTEWEGFETATKAAAAGGVTTIADMPLNSIPPTTTVENLKLKVGEAKGKVYVDVAFWGGIIPGNENELKGLVDAGVVGFKCFLCPSGVDEFPHVNEQDVKKALAKLQSLDSVLAFHAEYQEEFQSALDCEKVSEDPASYETFLRSRSAIMEETAIRMICEWCKSSKVRCHIVHLSAANALNLIKDAKDSGAPLTVETCYHYLMLSAEEVPQSATEFKCCPPIRGKKNQEKLWAGLNSGLLDMVVSDHSPCVENLKATGNFLTAWGGISSLQFGLPLLWTAARSRNMSLPNLSKLLSTGPAKLCKLDQRKGTIAANMDADFVIWDPDQTFKVETSNIFYKNKISPYKEKLLYGKVIATILGGNYIYKDSRVIDGPMGRLLLNNWFK